MSMDNRKRETSLEGDGTFLGKPHEIAMQALRIIAGEQQCIDNLMSHADIAREALLLIERATAGESKPKMCKVSAKKISEAIAHLKSAHYHIVENTVNSDLVDDLLRRAAVCIGYADSTGGWDGRSRS